ncbi:MAG: ferritin family protein [Gammaproteobacteria bacterium]|jgi:rubrerythrin|nr:ferritin family protein [Gammaproteobacteria bacterium]MBT3725995.1 ferritin family protein [Gammaproteobacteria bacterium]MBT4075126.1 ferritin family protein [Gammaproteobacteria bacterium]MBT4195268.1 ferritin family protein [Gammaproteobacteria bacterium]MBT4448611.1 ferritin family protein [Gammaproteobacteria bacterium]
MIKPESIEDLETFLALAYLLEIESSDRYSELADNMKVHNDPEVEKLFRKLSEYSGKHASEIIEHAEGMVLPNVASWDFEWQSPEGPETTAFDFIEYQITPERVLELALHNEIRGHEFYANIAKKSPSPEIRKLAAEFSDEESEHVKLLEQWIAEMAQNKASTRDDLDPPNMPE